MGGFTNFVIDRLIALGYKGEIKPFAIPNEFVSQATITEQLERFGLNPEQILDSLK